MNVQAFLETDEQRNALKRLHEASVEALQSFEQTVAGRLPEQASGIFLIHLNNLEKLTQDLGQIK